MSVAEEKLVAILEQLKKGVAPSSETVRTFLLWFGAERRGFNGVASKILIIHANSLPWACGGGGE